jgi:hypothetical protein
MIYIHIQFLDEKFRFLTQMEDFDIVFTLSELDITYTGVSSDLILVKGGKGGIWIQSLLITIEL